MNNIQNHPWFKEVSWKEIIDQKVTPTLKPVIKIDLTSKTIEYNVIEQPKQSKKTEIQLKYNQEYFESTQFGK